MGIEESVNAEQEFNEGVNAAIAEAVAAQSPSEAAEETQEAAGRTRDEKGRFAPVEAAEEPEASPEAPAEEPEHLYAGKYKTVEELERAVAEQEKLIGRQSQEVGDVRKALAEIESLKEQLAAPARPQYDQQAPSVVQALVDEGRFAEAATYTLQANPYLYQQVMETWAAEQPFQAMNFHSGLLLQESQRQQQAPAADPRVELAAQYAERAELERALDNVRAKHEDFVDVVGSLDDQRLSGIVEAGFPPSVLEGLRGDGASKEAVFETLYRWVKADQAGTLAIAAETAVAKRQAASRQAKIDATVGSASTSVEQQPAKGPEQEIADAIATEWAEYEKTRSLDQAWTGRPETRTPR